MFDGSGNNVLATLAHALNGAEDGPVVSLSAAGGEEHPVRLGAQNGEGLDQFSDLVEEFFGGEMPCDGSILTNARQADAIRRAHGSMVSALKGLRLGLTPDAVLTDVEEAMAAMGEVTGATVREDITARIFERFCVGK